MTDLKLTKERFHNKVRLHPFRLAFERKHIGRRSCIGPYRYDGDVRYTPPVFTTQRLLLSDNAASIDYKRTLLIKCVNIFNEFAYSDEQHYQSYLVVQHHIFNGFNEGLNSPYRLL